MKSYYRKIYFKFIRFSKGYVGLSFKYIEWIKNIVINNIRPIEKNLNLPIQNSIEYYSSRPNELENKLKNNYFTFSRFNSCSNKF